MTDAERIRDLERRLGNQRESMDVLWHEVSSLNAKLASVRRALDALNSKQPSKRSLGSSPIGGTGGTDSDEIGSNVER